MNFFGLDPESVIARINASGRSATPPNRRQSLLRGTIGFTIVSLIVFGVWAYFGANLTRRFGEAGFYAVCAVVFIGLTGLAMNSLIIGPGSLGRFYKLFSVAFAAYSVAWCAGWFALRGPLGGLVGTLAGTAVMGWILASAFAARGVAQKVISVLFAANTAGYFAGAAFYDYYRAHSVLEFVGVMFDTPGRNTTAKLVWGLCFGLGLGSGLGYAFYACQEEVRRRLSAPAQVK